MAAGLTIELQGAEEALGKLAAGAARVEHPKPLFDLIGAMLVTSTQHRFETGTDPEGHPWPLSIRVQLGGGRTMVDSAHLRNSLSHEADDAGVAVGTNVLYAAVHQFGAVIRPVRALALAFTIGGRKVFAQSVKIPRRAFLGLDAEDEKEIAEIADDYLLAPFDAAPGIGGGNAD